VTGAKVAVVTIAAGRHEHLRGQGWGLLHQTRPADLYVVVSMGDRQIAAVAEEQHSAVIGVDLEPGSSDLPLAAARNAGARAAIQAGAGVLVFLDVDCIPAPTTLARYADVLSSGVRGWPVVACGEVHYLPPVGHPSEYRAPGLEVRARPHPARPAPDPCEVLVAEDTRLFWSLSFALTGDDWEALGGFDEAYTGYGAEDTDFGQRLSAAGGDLLWVGGAAAYHQHHPTETPPIQHLRSIVRNANTFHDRWGWFPMEGWLADFATLDLAELDQATGQWRLCG
jgi:N-acetylglucosaminyl-diphospho-decaprenol L-rhamnosyltransferase